MQPVKPLNYIQFYNMMTDVMYDGFLVKTAGEHFYTIDPICYEWICYTGNTHWLDAFEPRKFEFSYFPYQVKLPPDYGHFIGSFEWLFDFPVSKQEERQIHSIANFFEWFVSTEKEPLQARLEQCKTNTRHILPEHIADKVCAYILSYSRQYPEKKEL